MLAAIVWQYSQALPWVIGGLALLCLFTLRIYPPQLRHIPRPWRWAPTALRMLAMTTIGISILRPVVTRQRTAAEQGPIVLLLDDSRSMAVVDDNRSPAEWVATAAAFGMLPSETRDKQTEAIQADCDRLSTLADEVTSARAELDYARLSGRGNEVAQVRLDQAVADLQSTARTASQKAIAFPQARALEHTLAYLENVPSGTDHDIWLDRIRDKARVAAGDAEQIRAAGDTARYQTDSALRDACLPLQSLSRLQLAETGILNPDAGLITRLGPETSVMGFGISDQITPFSTAVPGTAGEPLIARGTISNLTGGIRVILESMSVTPPRAVVLFSDGRQIGAETDAVTASTGVPIFTVSMAARSGLKDLAITSATVVSSAIVGDTITFRVEVRAVGLNGTTVNVTFTGNGPDEIRPITFVDEKPVTLSFTRQLNSTGNVRLALEMASVPGEASYENNRVERWINVLPRLVKPDARRPNPPPATRPATEAETADLTGDETFLHRLAESSGGQFLRLDQLDSLPKRLATVRQDISHPIEKPLWDGPYVFVLVLGCLTAEWGLRKRYGMA